MLVCSEHCQAGCSKRHGLWRRMHACRVPDGSAGWTECHLPLSVFVSLAIYVSGCLYHSLSVCLSVSLSVSLTVFVSNCLHVCLSVYQFVCLHLSLLVSLSVCVSVCLCLLVSVSLCLYNWVFIYMLLGAGWWVWVCPWHVTASGSAYHWHVLRESNRTSAAGAWVGPLWWQLAHQTQQRPTARRSAVPHLRSIKAVILLIQNNCDYREFTLHT